VSKGSGRTAVGRYGPRRHMTRLLDSNLPCSFRQRLIIRNYFSRLVVSEDSSIAGILGASGGSITSSESSSTPDLRVSQPAAKRLDNDTKLLQVKQNSQVLLTVSIENRF
jgi:hypothetical protein